ncbi:MAG TPA: hypothetical protein EYF95_05725 [Flavobacteriales bacterium]|nr:hypothetical protein [Flavobacteriales bacterium]
MCVGDIVMFIDEGRYAKWFYGKLGIVEQSTERTRSCRVRWLNPVKYFDSYTPISDFGWKYFEGYQDENR